MLPLRLWPTAIWVAAVCILLLLAHAVGLGVQLALIEASGGLPANALRPHSPQVEAYSIQVMAGFVPGLLAILIGLWSASLLVRQADAELVRLGWAAVIVIGVLAVALVALGLPWLRVGF